MMVRSQDDVILPIGYWGDVHGVTVPHPFLYIKICSVCVPLRHCYFLMALSSYFFWKAIINHVFFVIIVVVLRNSFGCLRRACKHQHWLFSCVCIQRVGLWAYMAVGLVSVLPFDIRPFIWRLKNVSAMSGFVQAVL